MLSTTNSLESPKTQQANNLEHALKYASMGLRVFPLKPGTKIPATAHGVKDATVDAATIAKWWTDSPDAGIGLAPELRVGGACFLEFDQKPSLKDWAKRTGNPMPTTRVHKSGGKGAPHYVFLHSERSVALGNCDGSMGGHEWFSFRAANRYIVAPPSIHPDSGEPYTTWADIEPMPIPDWVLDEIRLNGTREQDFAGDMPELDEDFEIDKFLGWVPVGTGAEDGSWIPFTECPVAGRRHKGQGVRGCALYYNGGKLGFKCHAAECPSNADRRPGQSGIGYLLSFLSQEHGAYPGVIWPQQTTEDLLEAFGAEEAAEDENVVAPAEHVEAPAAQVFGEAAAPSEARGGDTGLLPKRSILNAKQKDILAKKRKQQEVCEENWCGMCRGGCGKRIMGQFVCDDCVRSKQDKAFALQPGELELLRKDEGEKVFKQIVAIDAASIKPEETKWVWPHRIPCDAITWILGQPNNAKSLMTVDIVARATTGKEWADGEANTMGAIDVLMLCFEDSLSKQVVPRLMAHGADLSRVKFLDRRSFRTIAGDNDPTKVGLDLSEHLPLLLEMLRANPKYKMIVVDPIRDIFGNKRITHDPEVGPVLADLIEFCEKAHIAFVGVVHVPKKQTNNAIEKVAGGSAVAASAKSAFMLSRDEESDDKHHHVMTMVKWNYTGKTDGIKYMTEGTTVEHEGVRCDVAKIVWGETTSIVADDVLRAQNSQKEQRDRQQDKCEAFLMTLLKGGPQRSPDVYDAAKQLGFGDTTVKRALKAIGGYHIDRRAQRMGYWMSLEPNPSFSSPVAEETLSLTAGEAL